MKAMMRLFLTTCLTRLVAEDDPDAATLYAGIGDEIPESAAEKFGLVDGLFPEVVEAGRAADADGQGKPDTDAASTQDAAAAPDMPKDGDGKVENTIAQPSAASADAQSADGPKKETQAADDKEQAAVADKETKAGGKKSAGASK